MSSSLCFYLSLSIPHICVKPLGSEVSVGHMQVRKRKGEAGVPLPSSKLCIVLFAAEPERASGEPDCSGATSASPLAVHCFQPCASTRGCSVLTTAAAAAQEGQALVPSSEMRPGRQPAPTTLNRDNCQSHSPGASCQKATSGFVEQDGVGQGQVKWQEDS